MKLKYEFKTVSCFWDFFFDSKIYNPRNALELLIKKLES